MNGIDVLAARDLMNDMLLLRLAVPSRLVEIKKDDLMATAAEGAGAKASGLLKRAENLYTDLPRHHATLRRELERDHAELVDLLANPPGPFEQTAELTDKQAELAALTLELRLAAESPEAREKAAAADQRMAERGRKPGWSLLLNPTPWLVEDLGYPSADALRADVRHRERAAALAFAGQQEEAFAADVVAAQAEVEFLEAAGGRSPAAMYRVPEDVFGGLDEQSERAVIAIANGAQATQLLGLGEGVDKPAVLAAVAAAAHQHQHRILALPATEAAAAYAGEHRYADTTTAAEAGIDNLQSGRWRSVPMGSLLIVDDADQLPAAQLHWLAANAAATNSKLLLITNAGAPPPRHTRTDVLAASLPWAQHLGAADRDPHRSTAIARTEHYLATASGADTDQHTQSRQLLARRDQLADHYRATGLRSIRRTRDERDQSRDAGLEL